MKYFVATIKIARPPEAIWAVLMDATSYSDWAPAFIALRDGLKMAQF